MFQKRKIEDFLKSSIGKTSEINKISVEFLDDLGDKIYKLLLEYKEIKIDDVLPNPE